MSNLVQCFRLSLIILGVFFAGATHGSDPHSDEVAVPFYREVERLQKRLGPKDVPGLEFLSVDQDPEYADAYVFKRGRLKWAPRKSCRPMEWPEVCEETKDIKDFNLKRQVAQLRYHSDEMRSKILIYAGHFFEKMKKDPAIQERCCGDVLECKERFQGVKLILLKGARSFDEFGPSQVPLSETRERIFIGRGRAPIRWDGEKMGPIVIEVSDAKLLNCFTEQCIERFFMHELGHSCNFANLITSRGSEYLSLASDADREWEIKILKDKFGEETASCVVAAVSKSSKRYGKEFDTQQWLDEAFADMIFAPWRTEPDHFKWDCDSIVDVDHGPKSAHFNCLFKHTSLLKRVPCQ